MRKDILLFALPFLLLLSQCVSKEDNPVYQGDMKVIQCVKCPELDVPKDCFKSCGKYRQRFGMMISNFYEVDQCISIDLNGDSIVDSLGILRHFIPGDHAYQDSCYSYDFVDCNFHPTILIAAISSADGSLKSNYYPEIMWIASWNIGREYVDVFQDKPILEGEWDGNNGWYYKIYLSIKNDELFADSVSMESYGNYQYSNTFLLNDYLSEFDMDDLFHFRSISELRVDDERQQLKYEQYLREKNGK